MKKFFKEFKEFAMRGNVIDMAIGVVIGGAFGKIVTSLVSDLIMPAISLITGKFNFSDLAYTVAAADGKDIVIGYGAFIQTVIDFIIIALCIFLVIKLMNRLHKKKEDEPAAPPEPSKEEVLLTEIRDLLKEQNQKG